MAYLVRLPEVQKITGLSRSSIYQAIKENRFPKQIRIGKRAVAWLRDEILEWLGARIEEARPEVVQHEFEFGEKDGE